ncbi:MAG TPA: protein kinase [Gemmata sp.]|jgi:serine/threonine protein kinase|nr:protein kinase [Gemmata sp.]
MFEIFDCVGQAVMNKGVRGLCDFVPGSSYLLDVVGEAYRLIRDRRKAAQLREDIARIAAASTEEAKKVAEEVARKVAAEAKPNEQIALELYLTQIPGAVRASLKRSDDPSGKTVPPDFAVNSTEDLGKLLPQRVPHFRPGAELPGRPGWHLAELLGAGGFGEVWLARHTFIPAPRAVKFCTDPLVRTKLTSHEGKVIARVMGQGIHPNVVPLLDAVLDGETPWLMYEYVGGGCLTDLIHRWQKLASAEREVFVIAALHQLAAAVGTFHRLTPPIVHRDLKPANILISAELGTRNSEQRPVDATNGATDFNSEFRVPSSALKITDFGIGGVAVDYLRTNTPAGLSMLSMMTGWLETSLRGSYTPLYASPQQRAGNSPDPRDDVHALGVLGFQMLTGRLSEAPGIDAAEDLQDGGISAGLIALITKCVANKPDRRPKDATELAEKLAELKSNRNIAPIPKPVTETKPVETAPNSVKSGQDVSAPQNKTEIKPTSPIPNGSVPVKSSQDTRAPQNNPTPTPNEGGRVTLSPATPAILPSTKWFIPLRAMWFTRSVDDADAPWSLHNAKLPGEVAAKGGEIYRLVLNPDTTSDAELAKLRSLSGLPGLEAIDLSGCTQVTDAGLMHLAQLRGLKAVGLSETQVTDSGVTLLLTRFPDLEAVGLSGVENVSQTVIPYLTRLRKLKVLALPPRADTVDVRVEFTKRRPNCKLV